MHDGDAIVFETKDTWYIYKVFNELPETSKYNVDVLGRVPKGSGVKKAGRYITLTTCTPPVYTSKYRYIVWGRTGPYGEGRPRPYEAGGAPLTRTSRQRAPGHREGDRGPSVRVRGRLLLAVRAAEDAAASAFDGVQGDRAALVHLLVGHRSAHGHLGVRLVDRTGTECDDQAHGLQLRLRVLVRLAEDVARDVDLFGLGGGPWRP